MRALLLHNPNAGYGGTSPEDLLRPLRRADFDVAYQSTKEASFAYALRDPSDLIVVAGGDGTVLKVIEKLPDRSRPLAILPLGGANNIARSFGIEGRLEELAGLLRSPSRRPLTLGRAEGPWGSRLFVDGVGMGALARAIAAVHAAKIPRPDKLRAGRDAMRRILEDGHPDALRLTLDGATIERELFMAEAMNVRYTGPRLPLAPNADPGDDLLDLVTIGPDEREQMRAWLEWADADEPPPGTVQRGRKLTFTWRGEPLRIDDDLPDPKGAPAGVVVEMEPEPVMVVVPRPVGGSTT
jgi:diacylglycerol kinase (ATP)